MGESELEETEPLIPHPLSRSGECTPNESPVPTPPAVRSSRARHHKEGTISLVEELLRQSQEMLNEAEQRILLDGPFFPAIESFPAQSDGHHFLCETLYSLLRVLSRQTGFTTSQVRLLVGPACDHLARAIQDVLSQRLRVVQSMRSIKLQQVEIRSILHRFESADHVVRKYKNVAPSTVQWKSKELEAHMDVLGLADAQLKAALQRSARLLSTIHAQFLDHPGLTIYSSQPLVPPPRHRAPIFHASARFPPHLTGRSKNSASDPLSARRRHLSVAIPSRHRSRGDWEPPVNTQEQTRSKSVVLSKEAILGLLEESSSSTGFAFPVDMDPLIALWLRKFGFAQYESLFRGKPIDFDLFAHLRDVDFAEMGVSSGDDCLAMHSLLSKPTEGLDYVVLLEAVFFKQGKRRKSWKKRLFRMASTSEIVYTTLSPPHKELGRIEVGNIQEIEMVDDVALMAHAPPSSCSSWCELVLTTPDRRWLFGGEPAMMALWMELIHSLQDFWNSIMNTC